MPKSRPPYAPEFRRRMVDLVRAGREPEELAKEFEPSAQAIRNWVKQADLEGIKSGIEQQVRANPVRSLLVALGVGYLVGRAMRGSGT